ILYKIVSNIKTEKIFDRLKSLDNPQRTSLIRKYIKAFDPELENDAFRVMVNNKDQFYKNIAHYKDKKKRVELDLIINSVDPFIKKGGKVIFVPQDFQVKKEVALKILPTDILKPVCHHGASRSQLLKVCLEDVLEQAKLKNNSGPGKVLRAHGAVSGCNPLFGKKEWAMEPLHKDTNFLHAFKAIKDVRFDEDSKEIAPLMNTKLNEAQIKKVNEYFKDNYYTIKDNSKRHIFLTFKAATGIVLKWLAAANKDLSNVYVIGLPIVDEMPNMDKRVDKAETPEKKEKIRQMFKKIVGPDYKNYRELYGKYASLFRF
ncbi:hypothetical protein ACFL2K_04195, partial [Candidatus Margulisiibacteriota bacterium]